MEGHNELIGVTNGGGFSMNTVTRENNTLLYQPTLLFFSGPTRHGKWVKNKYGHYIISTKTGLYVFDSSGKIIVAMTTILPRMLGRTELWFGGWIETLSNDETFQITHFFDRYISLRLIALIDYSKKANALKQVLWDRRAN
jgi:hypothetical protein